MPRRVSDSLREIRLMNYDPNWPRLFRREAGRIRGALGPRALRVEHIGSTAVPGLLAKPVIDVLVAVFASADENSYLPALEEAGYVLTIREPAWHEHRMLKGPDTDVNLHVFSSGCPEIGRVLTFRNWLRRNAADRDLYASTKLVLAENEWRSVEDYADSKAAVITEILARAQLAKKRTGGVGSAQECTQQSGTAGGSGQRLMTAINLQQKLGLFRDYWSPRIVARYNDNDVIVVKAKGEFNWHLHADTDDLFLVLQGKLEIRFRDGVVTLGPGDLYVIPAGVEHYPVATEEVRMLLIEPTGTPNTGDQGTAALKHVI